MCHSLGKREKPSQEAMNEQVFQVAVKHQDAEIWGQGEGECRMSTGREERAGPGGRENLSTCLETQLNLGHETCATQSVLSVSFFIPP